MYLLLVGKFNNKVKESSRLLYLFDAKRIWDFIKFFTVQQQKQILKCQCVFFFKKTKPFSFRKSPYKKRKEKKNAGCEFQFL